MEKDKALREQLVQLMRGGNAHIDFDSVTKDFPPNAINRKADRIPYTPWHVLEHMRLAQWDILEFSRNPNHVSPNFPDGYWPAANASADEETWRKSIESFHSGFNAMVQMVEDPATDLYARIPHGEGQTILREALVVADHNSYHLGVLATLKRILSD